MVYSDTTNKNGIIQFTEDLCKLGDGGITGDSTLFKKMTSLHNQAYKNVAMALLRSDRYWKWDDYNYTNFPIATIDIVAGQRDYTLPAATSGGNASTLYRINKVEILNGNEYFEMRLMDLDELESTESSLSTRYSLMGNSIRLKDLPPANITAGLRITFQRSIVEFTTASTTTQPGFMDSYHDLLSYHSAYTYLLPINKDLAVDYFNIYEKRLKLLISDNMNKNENSPKAIRPIYRNPM